MARPILRTKFRGTGQTENETFISANGSSMSIFKYGTAGRTTTATYCPDFLAAHFGGFIYAIEPEVGIWKNTPPGTGCSLIHSFTSPQTSILSSAMGWKPVNKNGKTQLMTTYLTTTSATYRMVFIDDVGTVTETSNIPTTISALQMSNGILVENKIYSVTSTSSNLDLMIIDPEQESINNVAWSTVQASARADICAHSGTIYGMVTYGNTTAGFGNQLWRISGATPAKIGEWNAHYNSSSFYPTTNFMPCIFSTDDNLYAISLSDNSDISTSDKFDIWKIEIDGNGAFTGVNRITDAVFGFDFFTLVRSSKFTYFRDIESTEGSPGHVINMALGDTGTEGKAVHSYRFNGPAAAATYLGFSSDAWSYDQPIDKLGGGTYTFTDQNELNWTMTSVEISGIYADIYYHVTGISEAGGVSFCPKYNNQKDSPLTAATVTVIDGGTLSGGYITGITAGDSGAFRWNLETDNISAGDVPNLNVQLIRV